MRALLVSAFIISVSAAPAFADPGDRDFGIDRSIHERSDFDRAIDRAPREARETPDRDRAEKVDRDTHENRAGLDHDGIRADISERASVGPELRGDTKEVNVRIDIERPDHR